jgi:hypothetical protein
MFSRNCAFRLLPYAGGGGREIGGSGAGRARLRGQGQVDQGSCARRACHGTRVRKVLWWRRRLGASSAPSPGGQSSDRCCAELHGLLVANGRKTRRDRLAMCPVFEALQDPRSRSEAVRPMRRAWHRERRATAVAAYVRLVMAGASAGCGRRSSRPSSRAAMRP